jgi:ubiquinone/menaquinone biosynthesis C-methylase UbiE
MTSGRKQRVESFFTGLASTYDTVIPFFDAFATELVAQAELGAGERVLDVACGTGRCARAAARAVGPSGRVIATDLTAAMVAVAATHAPDPDLAPALAPVHFAVADAEHLGVRAGRADAVTCGFGVFFFPEPGHAFTEIRRVLASGGRFAATTFADGVAGYPWSDDVTSTLGYPPSLAPSPVLTHHGLSDALTDAGFTDVHSTAVDSRFTFTDVDHYLGWCWSTGTRRLLSSMSPDELDRFRTLSAERLAAHRVDGGYELHQPVHVTVARRS